MTFGRLNSGTSPGTLEQVLELCNKSWSWNKSWRTALSFMHPMEVTMPARNPVSTANLYGHPIHPMLISFPVAFFVATFVCDLGYWATRNDIWATAAIWLLGAGIIMTALAGIAGLTDFIGDRRIRDISDSWQHAIGNVIVVLIQIFSFYERYRYGTSAILPIGLIASLIVVCILLFTGWKGWEMVYRHRVAVYDAPRPSASGQSETQPRRAA